MALSTGTLITPRYHLLAPLGEGSMGTVYRAHDRLSGQDVALKRVVLDADDADALRLALAHEFRTLAGLRHPHIISVLDYGFDAERQPFFTMELLQGAQTLLDAARTLPRAQQIELLIQALEALAYLHRRGVLHHDLKPENILVANGRVRLLDFGLAVLADQQRADDAFGTLQYMAPEVVDGVPYTPQADLYSLGVIAYELLLGCHPIAATSVRGFLDALRTTPPDLTALAGTPALAQVLGQLLAKTAQERPASAQAAIELLRVAAGLPAQASDVAIRESYLQAAAFVGRTHELHRLTTALEQARQGKGVAFLIGGESGVGKSRLIDELRTLALVSGFTVLRGHGVEGGGVSYQLWREPLRALLATNPPADELTAGVLLPLVPDLPQLLGHPVTPAPELLGEAGRLRLLSTIVEMVIQNAGPTLLILEDLHLASESLLPLPYLLRQISTWPILLVGSYRSDERPELPRQLTGMQSIELARLTPQELAALSSAMLGEAGRQPELQALIQRETEGNAFFAVEVVRALAVQAGDLRHIQTASLPRHIIAGGVHGIVMRRLAKVPTDHRPMLGLLAVAGRVIEPDLLRTFAGSDAAAERWLAACADVAVIEIHEGQWQFQHGKIREAALADIPAGAAKGLHRQVAEALSLLHPGDPDQAARLAGHWRIAGDAEQERSYALQAGRYAATQYNHHDALTYLTRGLELLPPDDLVARFAVQSDRYQSLRALGETGAQGDLLLELSQLANTAANPAGQVDVLLLQANLALDTGEFERGHTYCQQALALAEQTSDQRRQAEVGLAWGNLLVRLRRFAEALDLVRQSAAIFQQLNDQRGATHADHLLGTIFAIMGDTQQSLIYLSQSLQHAQQINDVLTESLILNNIGLSYVELGAYDQAQAAFHRALAITQKTGNIQDEISLRNSQGLLNTSVGDYGTAIAHFIHCIELCQKVNARTIASYALSNLAWAYAQHGSYTEAHITFQQAIAAKQELGNPWSEAYTWNRIGHMHLRAGDLGAAGAAYQQAAALLVQVEHTTTTVETWAGLAAVAQARRDTAQALASAERVWAYMSDKGLAGEWEWAISGLQIYQVFQAVTDPRSAQVLALLEATVQAQAAAIQDPGIRAAFLANVPANREITQLAQMAARSGP